MLPLQPRQQAVPDPPTGAGAESLVEPVEERVAVGFLGEQPVRRGDPPLVPEGPGLDLGEAGLIIARQPAGRSKSSKPGYTSRTESHHIFVWPMRSASAQEITLIDPPCTSTLRISASPAR